MEDEDVACCTGRRAGEPSDYFHGVCRDHSWQKCIFMSCGLSLCITVDILQYSMPLAFLPSVLEDRGHAPMKIATAIGVYYWTGFLGQCCILTYQIIRLVRSKGGESEEVLTVGVVKRQIYYLIAGLGVGAVTLLCQSMHPRWWVHTTCRFFQGLAGAFIFFYCFLLSANLFKGGQQTFAMTMSSTALNVAEVLGSSVGAWLFDRWGQEAVFLVLGCVSILNQFVLVGVIAGIKGNGVNNTWQSEGGLFITNQGWSRLRDVLRSERLLLSTILIVTAAIVKASVEEVLPFHADHRWHMEPLQIGSLFSIVAFTYILSSALAGQSWHVLRHNRVMFSAFWLSMLGFVTWGLFWVSSVYHHYEGLYAGLLLYGVCLGMTHTPSALLLGEAVDEAVGTEKETINGVWNTMWEAGGSIGFLLGGLLAHDYARQLRLFAFYAGMCTISSAIMVYVGGFWDEKIKVYPRNTMCPDEMGYGSTTPSKDV